MALSNVDLDALPPKVLGDEYGATISASALLGAVYPGKSGWLSGGPVLAAWEEPADPTRQGCSDLLSAQGVQYLPLSSGSRFCVRTAGKRLAAVTVEAMDEANYTYSATVTVWNGYA